MQIRPVVHIYGADAYTDAYKDTAQIHPQIRHRNRANTRKQVLSPYHKYGSDIYTDTAQMRGRNVHRYGIDAGTNKAYTRTHIRLRYVKDTQQIRTLVQTKQICLIYSSKYSSKYMLPCVNLIRTFIYIFINIRRKFIPKSIIYFFFLSLSQRTYYPCA